MYMFSAYTRKKKKSKGQKGKGWGMIFEIHSDLTYNVIQLRAHARTKRNDFPVGRSPPTSDMCIRRPLFRACQAAKQFMGERIDSITHIVNLSIYCEISL